MPRLRSVVVVAALLLAAIAGSSAPDGFSGPRQPDGALAAAMGGGPARVAAALDRDWKGKRWAVVDHAGKRWG